jgi:hypothetical protein
MLGLAAQGDIMETRRWGFWEKLAWIVPGFVIGVVAVWCFFAWLKDYLRSSG